MAISRRDFIKTAAGGLLGGVLVYGGLPVLMRNSASASESPQVGSNEDGSAQRHWRYVVDIDKCIGCGKCANACKLENGVPFNPKYNRTWIERYVMTEDEKVLVDSPEGGIHGFDDKYQSQEYANINIRKSFFVPKLCNQCDKPPCVSVCPVKATFKTKEGAILIDRKACIGCRYCVQACPFGARFFVHDLGIVDKCTWCYHRTTKGLLPACVEVCPTGARSFGDIGDSESQVSQIIKKQAVGILKPELGTENKVYYLNLERVVL